MKTLKTKDKTRPVEPEQESYGMCCIKNELEELIETFSIHLEEMGRSTRTISIYRRHIGYWKRYLRENKINRTRQITAHVVSGYQAWIFSYKTRFGKPFTLSSQRSVLITLRLFLRFLVKRHLISSDVVEVLQVPRQPSQLPGQALTPREVKKMLAQPNTETIPGFRDRTLLETIYSTGLRMNELRRLRVKDINLTEKTLLVVSGKGEKDRVVPLGKTACLYLAEYLKTVRPLLAQRAAKKTHESERRKKKYEEAADLVFLNRYGHILSRPGLLKKLHIYSSRAGIKKQVTVHTFRHTIATEMLKGGADLRQIQELLGHAKLTTTQLYTRLVKGELKRVQAHCHPREQSDLPAAAFKYRGRNYLTEHERTQNTHLPPR